jgi:thiazolylpeptide-type bacteriocin precursor
VAYSLKPAARTEPGDVSLFTEEVLQLEADVFEVVDYADMRDVLAAPFPSCAYCSCCSTAG